MLPIIIEVAKEIVICIIETIKNGNVYPLIKSTAFIGDAYNLVKNALVRSFDTCIHVNSITKVSPNNAIPGAKVFISA